MFRWFKREAKRAYKVPEIMKTALEPMALAVAIAERVTEHFKAIERGDVPFPAYKAKKVFGAVQIWKCTRLEVLRQMWGHGASKLILLAEPTEQSKLLTAFFDDKPHLEFPHQPDNDPIHDTLQALFQVYLNLEKAGSDVADPNTDRQSLKLAKKTILGDFERLAVTIQQEREEFDKRVDGGETYPPMPKTMLDILYEDVTAKTKTIALCAMLGPDYMVAIKQIEELMAEQIKQQGGSDRKVEQDIAVFRAKFQEVLNAKDPDELEQLAAEGKALAAVRSKEVKASSLGMREPPASQPQGSPKPEPGERTAAYEHGVYATAFRKYKLLAEQGDAGAQLLLGLMYIEGRGVPKNNKQAAKWLRKAAKQGNADAQLLLGPMPAAQGNEEAASAQPAMAREVLNAKDPEGFEEDFVPCTGCGRNLKRGSDCPACGEVQLDWDEYDEPVLEEGEPDPVDPTDAYERGDYATAFREYKLLAEQGDAGAQFYLGVMYKKGRGVPNNYELAVKWLRKAAEQGYAAAHFLLGEMYSEGLGVPKNDVLAVELYRKAAEQGIDIAQFYLGAMYGTGRGVSKNYELAVKWLRKAAEQGQVNAQYSLGVMYSEGQGVPKNDVLAYMWYSLAAARGYTKAGGHLEKFKKLMTPTQLATAREMATKWKPRNGNPAK